MHVTFTTQYLVHLCSYLAAIWHEPTHAQTLVTHQFSAKSVKKCQRNRRFTKKFRISKKSHLSATFSRFQPFSAQKRTAQGNCLTWGAQASRQPRPLPLVRCILLYFQTQSAAETIEKDVLNSELWPNMNPQCCLFSIFFPLKFPTCIFFLK